MDSLSILPPKTAAPAPGGERPPAPDGTATHKPSPNGCPRLTRTARDRLRHLSGVMVIARQEARSSASAVRRARRHADPASEELALLDLAYHRCRHRLARRSASRLRRRLVPSATRR